MMMLLASMAVVAGHKNRTATAPYRAAVVPPCSTPLHQLAFLPPLVGHGGFCWVQTKAVSASARSRHLLTSPAARASTLAVEAKQSPDGNTVVLAAAGSDKQTFAGQGGGDANSGGGGGGGGGADAGNGGGRGEKGRGKRRKLENKSLQERLNNMRLDFSLEGREPYVAGAPARIMAPPESPSGSTSSSGATAGRQAMYHNYRRRRRPLNALCMPKNQRPQGCAPLLPPIATQAQQPAVVDHVTLELNRVGEDLSAFKSDLPCVTSGTCPVPSFRCSKGHVWESNGSPVCFYCPVCADTRIKTRMKRNRDLEAMQEIARGKGGECIADEYLGMDEKIAFRCGDGHEWLTSPANLVYKNTWCPKCAALRSAERKKLTLADMHQTARQFGGVFLSPEYHGASVKHEWRCKRGHTFWNTPNNVRRAEGGRRVATFCKTCTIMDRNILKAALVGGLSKDEAKSTLEELAKVGAMPMRRHFLKRRATGKSTLASKRRKMKRITNIKRISSSDISSSDASFGKSSGTSSGGGGGGGGGGTTSPR